MSPLALAALLGVAWAGDADLALYRHQAALAAGEAEQAWLAAAAAVQADPLDWRAHRAWQDALIRAHAGWWMEAEYSAMASGSDPSRRLVGLTWEATRSGAQVPAVEGADPQAQALLAAAVALERGDARQALARVAAVEGPDAAALRLHALAALDEDRELARVARATRQQWPERVDLLAPLWQEDGLLPWLARCGVVADAEAALASADPLTLYRAHALLVAAGDTELAAQASERLLAVGEPWKPGTRPPWRGVMVRDLARVLALQADPQPPPGGTADETQRVLAATAREQARKGKTELAASTWRKALSVDAPDADLLLEAALALEAAGAGPAELLALCAQARAAAALTAELPQTAVQAQATLAQVYLMEARCLRALGRQDQALQAAQLATICGAGPAALVLRAELLEAQGHPQAAFSAYAQAWAAGVPGLEPHLERLYAGPATLEVVLAAWPSQRAAPDRAAVEDAARFPTRALNTSLGVVDLGAEERVVVAFWASWCGPCAQELPELDALAGRLAAGGAPVRIVAVSVDEQQRDYERWQRSNSFTNLHLVRAPDLGRQAGVQGIPSTWLLGPQGEVLWFHQGYSPGDVGRLEAELERARLRDTQP